MSRRRSRTPKFKRRRRSRLLSWWTLWRVPALLAIVSAAWWFLYRPYVAELGWIAVTDSFALCGQGWGGAAGCVVDGDTIIIGSGSARRRIRLTGYDAPEIEGACPAETQRAQEARRALHEWLGEGPFEWNGEGEPPRDQYGRELREARRAMRGGGYEYLGETMIRRGLASETGWGSSATDWCR